MKKIVLFLVVFLLCGCSDTVDLYIDEQILEVKSSQEEMPVDARVEEVQEESLLIMSDDSPGLSWESTILKTDDEGWPLSEQYAVQTALCEDGEVLGFFFELTVVDPQTSKYYTAVVLTISDSAGEFVQQLEFETYAFAIRDDSFVDLNFDGYLDFRCFFNTQVGPRGHFCYLGWVYNPEIGLFEETNLDEIVDMSVDEALQVIRSRYVTGGLDATHLLYRYMDGEFVVTNRLDIQVRTPYDYITDKVISNYVKGIPGGEGPPYTCYTEYYWEDGELVPMPVICDTEEGVDEYYEHLYGPDSIWYPNAG